VSDPPWSLRAAAALGERLVGHAVRHDGRCTWLTHDIDETGAVPVVVETTCGPDLYAGAAGIGWGLARLAAVTQDARTAEVATAALRFSVERAPQDPSLHAGRAGIAWAALDAGHVLGSEELVTAGHRLARDVARQVLAGDPAAQGWDLLGGLAGVCLALATAPDEDAVLIDAAVAGAESLVALSREVGRGRAWPTAGSDEPPLCGLAHGAVGAAVALASVDAAAGTHDFEGAVEAALSYERQLFDPAGSWPDLRDLSRLALLSGERPRYPVQWCHGAVGGAIARARLAQRRREDPSLLAECAAGIDRSTAFWLRRIAHAPGSDLSVCHGVGGAVEVQLEAFALTGDREHLEHAERLMLRGLGVPDERLGPWRAGAVGDAELRRATSGLPCGIPGAPEVPGLMVGLAGLLVVLLRLPDPLTTPAPGLPGAARLAEPRLGPAASVRARAPGPPAVRSSPAPR
jgi:lantibiotic biosynthesis protein